MDGYTWFAVLSSSLSGGVWKIIKEIFIFFGKSFIYMRWVLVLLVQKQAY